MPQRQSCVFKHWVLEIALARISLLSGPQGEDLVKSQDRWLFLNAPFTYAMVGSRRKGAP